MPENRPYVSVVVTARNDDHGGDLLRRMQTFVNAWIGQCKRHRLCAELVVVDWNPPADRPPLMAALQWPADTGPCQVRFIQVPRELHQRYLHAEALPLYQMIAKNVGIRRSRGRFILATNIDILFSDELVRFLAEGRLETGCMYRIDRHDVMSDVPVSATVEEQLEYCRSHLLRVNAGEGTFSVTGDGKRALSGVDIADPGSGIHLGAGWFSPERTPSEQAFRWVENDAEVVIEGADGAPAKLVFDVEPGPGVNYQPFVLQVLDAQRIVLAQDVIRRRCRVEVSIPELRQEARFFLRALAGGRSTDHDPRVLNFRVYRCSLETLAAAPESPAILRVTPLGRTDPVRTFIRAGGRRFFTEGGIRQGMRRALYFALQRYRRPRRLVSVVPPGEDVFDFEQGIAPGSGWYDLEYVLGESFRWARNDAELRVRIPHDASRKLVLHIEPGPGLGWRPFDLSVLHPSGQTLAKVKVQKLERVEIAVPGKPGETQALVLRCPGGGSHSATDLRVLNFRVFWCSWSGSHQSIGKTKSDLEFWLHAKPESKVTPARYLHTNACGDFTLMAREHWLDLRGYPEFDMYSFHIDSLLCYAAHHAGASEVLLKEPMRIYHIEHGQGSGWTPEGQDQLFRRLQTKRIPFLTYEELVRWIVQMRRLNCPVIFNRENWGLGEFELPETELPKQRELSRAQWA